ncbi:hypothetical protein AAHB65_29235 [Bacillus toyonensis]
MLLDDAATNPNQSIGRLEILTVAEKNTVLEKVEWWFSNCNRNVHCHNCLKSRLI